MATHIPAAAESTSLASAVYRHYAWLMHQEQEALGGRLLLVAESGSHAFPGADTLVQAANIAGAATLLLNGDPHAARDRVRSGVCDFLVTTLDEGLRILKNELRRKLPAAVCLLADPSPVLEECAQRGVQPDFLAITVPSFTQAGENDPAASRLRASRGARLVSVAKALLPSGASWQMASWTMPPLGMRALPAMDALALRLLEPQASLKSQDNLGPQDSKARRRWLMRAPQYLGRAHAATHTMPMHRAEADRLTEAVLLEVREGRLPAGVRLHHGADELLPSGT